jgi:NADH-quinone oxidoreductase subunit K
MLDDATIYLMTSAVLFSIGAMGVAIRRNPLVMFMCIELMLNASNLAFAGFARYGTPQSSTNLGGPGDGAMFVFLVMIVAAAEAVIGLGIIIAIFRSRANVDVDELAALKG